MNKFVLALFASVFLAWLYPPPGERFRNLFTDDARALGHFGDFLLLRAAAQSPANLFRPEKLSPARGDTGGDIYSFSAFGTRGDSSVRFDSSRQSVCVSPFGSRARNLLFGCAPVDGLFVGGDDEPGAGECAGSDL